MSEKKEKLVGVSVKFLVEEKGGIEVLLEGHDVGLANLLVEKLLEDKSVDFAAVDYVHPTLRTPVLKVQGKNPKKSVLDATGEVEKALKALELSKR
ncbi:MAG: RpoL/Rpb11 RNA polymerase subunit family protein [Candidatus Micrarchaeota archaeon]